MEGKTLAENSPEMLQRGAWKRGKWNERKPWKRQEKENQKAGLPLAAFVLAFALALRGLVAAVGLQLDGLRVAGAGCPVVEIHRRWKSWKIGSPRWGVRVWRAAGGGCPRLGP